MLSQLEQVCKTYSTESSSGLIEFEFDSNWQRIFVTALTFLLDQAIIIINYCITKISPRYCAVEYLMFYRLLFFSSFELSLSLGPIIIFLKVANLWIQDLNHMPATRHKIS